jgi:glutamate formiminotransferase
MQFDLTKKMMAVSLKIAEGEKKSVIDEVARMIEGDPEIVLLDLRRRQEYNYTIIKFVGELMYIFLLLDKVSSLILKLIDYSKIRSPFHVVGALSSITLFPIRNIPQEDYTTLIDEFSQSFFKKFKHPVFVFLPEPKDKKQELYKSLYSWKPETIKIKLESGEINADYGGRTYHPKHGITLTRIQKYIVSMLFYLDTSDLDTAQEIANIIGRQGKIRYDKKGQILKDKKGQTIRKKGRYSTVSSFAGCFTSDEMVQILCNISDYENPTLYGLYESIKEIAINFMVEVPGCSILGYLPFEAIRSSLVFYDPSLNFNELNMDEQIEYFSNILNLGEFGPFNPNWQIIEKIFIQNFA